MIRSLWISKTGMEAQQTQLDVVSNNLANVNTTGFKRSRAVFEDLLYQNAREPGAQSSQQTALPSGMQIGTGTRIVATSRLHSQGNLSKTGNAKDVAINGNGFFQVQRPDGTLAYTRDGNFQISAQGQLVTSSGYLVQPAMMVPRNATSLMIGKDGVVTVTTPGMVNRTQVGAFQLANFVNPAGLRSLGENLYAETEASGGANLAVPGGNGLGMLHQNYVETSNVNVVEEMIQLIQTQRAYEINSKAVRTADRMLEKIAQLK